MKTAVYLRQSLDRDQNHLAIDRQREACLALCTTKGWTDIAEYADNDTSATVGRRPQYQQLLADIESGAVGAVVCYHLDRLHRRPIELEHFIDLADRRDLKLATVTGDVNLGTDNGRLIARITGAVAKAEVERKSARQKAANAQRAKQGKAWVTRAFGYKGDRVVRSEARALQQAYSALLGGESLYGIAQQWNSKGIPSITGAQWSGTRMRQMLLNCRYAGLQKHRGQILEGVTPSWPAIVERDVWEAAVAILTDPARHTGKSTGRKYLLTGIAVCGICHRTMGTTQRSTKTGAKRVVYQCKRQGCMRVVRGLEKVDAVVTDVVCERLSQPDAAAVLARPTTDTAAERDRVNVLRARLDSLAVDFADGDLTASQLRTATERIKAQLAEAESKLLDSNTSRVLDGVIGEPDAAERFAKLPLDRKRAVIDALCTVTILPTTEPGGRFDPTLIAVEWR